MGSGLRNDVLQKDDGRLLPCQILGREIALLYNEEILLFQLLQWRRRRGVVRM
jgi:hypothetical protein